MSKQQELLERIQTEFQPHFATVENESHMHSSGRGADSHFKLVIMEISQTALFLGSIIDLYCLVLILRVWLP